MATSLDGVRRLDKRARGFRMKILPGARQTISVTVAGLHHGQGALRERAGAAPGAVAVRELFGGCASSAPSSGSGCAPSWEVRHERPVEEAQALALFGIATDDGVVMATYLRDRFATDTLEYHRPPVQPVIKVGKLSIIKAVDSAAGLGSNTGSDALPGAVAGKFLWSASQEPSMGKKALIVDDSPTIREVQRHLLGREGYQVFIAEDGLEGFRIARSEQPDVVLLDIVMPRMGGVECCRRIKKDSELQGATVIMVTAKEELAQLREAYAAGCDGYLTKPLDVKELQVKINSIDRLRQARGVVRQVLDRRPS